MIDIDISFKWRYPLYIWSYAILPIPPCMVVPDRPCVLWFEFNHNNNTAMEQWLI